jgi:hypothetical protein
MSAAVGMKIAKGRPNAIGEATAAAAAVVAHERMKITKGWPSAIGEATAAAAAVVAVATGALEGTGPIARCMSSTTSCPLEGATTRGGGTIEGPPLGHVNCVLFCCHAVRKTKRARVRTTSSPTSLCGARGWVLAVMMGVTAMCIGGGGLGEVGRSLLQMSLPFEGGWSGSAQHIWWDG